MAGEFTKPSSISPAVIGAVADPDEYNQNIAGQSKDSVTFIDIDGAFADGNIGDETLGTNGSLCDNIKMREGGFVKIYNSSAVFQKNVNLDQATTSLLGQTYLPDIVYCDQASVDADHDIRFFGGTFQFDDGSGQATSTDLEKKIDATWSAGDAAGGLDTGTVAVDTTYHMFVIHNPTTVTSDYLFSTSLSSPTLPSGYTKKKRIASIITDGSANIKYGKFYFSKDGSYKMVYRVPVLDVSTNPGTSSVDYGLTVPAGLDIIARINVSIEGTTDSSASIQNLAAYVREPTSFDYAPNYSGIPGVSVSAFIESNTTGSTYYGVNTLDIKTSGQNVSIRANTDVNDLFVVTLGYTDLARF